MKRWVIGIVISLLAVPALAYEPLVKKNVFELPVYETLGGKTIKNVKVGWESYGTLNAAKDNTILICHYFSGTSHAAGRYTAEDKRPGYWDAIIGSGRPVDTDKFYVLSVDSLVNLGTGNPKVITTGPASINPATGKPYGMTFPIVTIRDFVNVQKALLESMGIKRLHAVMGASMGALQTYEWASAYPDMVARAVPVIGAGWADGNLIAWLNIWAAPIRLDPNWNGGNYYDGEPPLQGLAEALKIVTLHAQHWEWANGNFGRAWARADLDPAASFDHQYKIETILDGAGLARAKVSDANHFLYLVKANQLFLTGHGQSYVKGLQRIKAPTLIIHSDEDLVFFPEEVRETAAYIRAGGTQVDIVELQGTRGHLDGVLSIGQAGATIKTFIEN
ncbi:MAG: homoserine O-acetyltransferase [Desulfobacterales bacterium]|nr:homoserine O-acetyltransferase [Desulfobacterales bacterium]